MFCIRPRNQIHKSYPFLSVILQRTNDSIQPLLGAISSTVNVRAKDIRVYQFGFITFDKVEVNGKKSFTPNTE